MKRSCDDNSLVAAMMNGFGPPNNQQYHPYPHPLVVHLQPHPAKPYANSNNLNGAVAGGVDTDDDAHKLSSGRYTSQNRSYDGGDGNASEPNSTKRAPTTDWMPTIVASRTNRTECSSVQSSSGTARGYTENVLVEADVAFSKAHSDSIPENDCHADSEESIHSKCVREIFNCQDSLRDEAGMNADDYPLDEPDEVPCILPFIPVDVVENMVDPLMDTYEAGDAMPNACHNGEDFGASEDDDDNDSSSVEFVSEESAVARSAVVVVAAAAAAAAAAESSSNNVVPIKRRNRVSNFRCTECLHSFDTESELELHTETLDVALLCVQCESSFWSPCALNRHKSEHAAAMQQMAYAPGYDPDFESSSYHNRGGLVDKPYTCKHCGAGYSTKFNLMRHVRKNVVWLKSGEPYRCDQCDATFSARCLLPIHKQEKHWVLQDLDSEMDARDICIICKEHRRGRLILVSAKGRRTLIACSEARKDGKDEEFKSATSVLVHAECRKKYTNPNMIKTIKKEMAESSSNNTEPSVEAEVEAEAEAESVIVTPQFDLLERDCDSLDAEPPLAPTTPYHTFRTATAAGVSYNCKWCPERFPTHPALVKHIGDEHPDVQLFRCEPCNKTFLNKAGLYGHLTHHRFQCDKCDMNFSSNDFLIQHRLVHGDDPSASAAGSSTTTITTTTNTTTATNTATSSTTASVVPQPPPASSPAAKLSPPPKPTAPRTRYNKPKCEGTPYFELLARVPHMKKPFECEFCGKKFMYKTTYLEHYLTHTGERPFRCSFCDQGFIRERAMEIHQSSHGDVVAQTTASRVTTASKATTVAPTTTAPAAAAAAAVTAAASAVVTTSSTIEKGAKQQTARKSTSSAARPASRINPVGRAVINAALFDPQLDVTPEDREAFYFLPVVAVKMVDVSALEQHAYVCPYCDKFFPRPSSLCGHKKICSYLTRRRAQKAAEAAMGLAAPTVARKWGPRAAVGSARSAPAAAPRSRANFSGQREGSTVEIANMRHHIVFAGGERVFVCGVCGKQFARKFTLSEHCRSHTTDRPFNCDRCPRAFKRKSSLFRHRRRNHTKNAAADHCAAAASSAAQHPMADHNWMSFEPQCNVKIEISDEDEDDDDDDDGGDGDDDETVGRAQSTKPIVDLNEGGQYVDLHESNYDYSEMSVFEPQCIVKDEAYSDEEGLGLGLGLGLDLDLGQGQPPNRMANATANYYPVEDCGDLMDASMNHFLEVGVASNGDPARYGRPDEAAVASELEYEQWQQQQEQQLAAVNRFLCGECNRRFPRREELRRHFAEHDSVGPYKCFYCDKTFDRRKYLSKHARNHSKKKSFQCSFCERAYVTNAELVIHVRIHTGERPFECDQCGKGFRVQKQLTLHYRTHTGEKPYSCAHCCSTFSRHETLFRHGRVCQAKQCYAVAASSLPLPAAESAPAPALAPAHPRPPSSLRPTAPAAQPPVATPQLSQLLQQPPAPPLPQPQPQPQPQPPPNQQSQLASFGHPLQLLPSPCLPADGVGDATRNDGRCL